MRCFVNAHMPTGVSDAQTRVVFPIPLFFKRKEIDVNKRICMSFRYVTAQDPVFIYFQADGAGWGQQPN